MCARRYVYVREDEIRKFLLENPGATMRKLRERFHSNIRQTIHRLIRKGKVKCELYDKYGLYYWVGGEVKGAEEGGDSVGSVLQHTETTTSF